MRTWRRAYKGHRCGFCGLVFKGGEPLLEIGAAPLKRCAACAKARYSAAVPDPFPEPERVPVRVPTLPFSPHRQPDFVTPRSWAQAAAADFKAKRVEREPGEDG